MAAKATVRSSGSFRGKPGPRFGALHVGAWRGLALVNVALQLDLSRGTSWRPALVRAATWAVSNLLVTTLLWLAMLRFRVPARRFSIVLSCVIASSIVGAF